MVRRKRVVEERVLTDVELEIMTVVWQLGRCTVKEVQETLKASRDLAYTSVATMMRILEGKGVLVSRKGERAHTYEPAVSRVDYEARHLRHVADRLFHGSPSSMVMRMLSDSEISPEELKSLRALLDERLKP